MQLLTDYRTAIPSSGESEIFPFRRADLNTLLNARLAEAVDLHMQMKQAHWNVRWPNFIGLQDLFAQLAQAVESYVEKIAARIVQRGGIAEGTVRISGARSVLDEYPLTIDDGMGHVEAVGHALAAFARDTRCAINEAMELDDVQTARLFTEILQGVEQLHELIAARS